LQDYDGSNGANPYFGSAFIELAELAPLPIMVLNFSGDNNGKTNKLSWSIANEQNLDHFVLERSGNGQNFTDIAKIKSRNDLEYSYDDVVTADTSVVYYYRLKIVDIDGNFKYSDIVKITLRLKEVLAFVNPNPFKDLLVVTVQSPSHDNGVFTLTDLNGRQLFRRNESLSPGSNVIYLNENGKLPGGTYILTIITSNKTTSFKLVKSGY
jgi:hypothetical protein